MELSHSVSWVIGVTISLFNPSLGKMTWVAECRSSQHKCSHESRNQVVGTASSRVATSRKEKPKDPNGEVWRTIMASSCESHWTRVRSVTEGSTFAWLEQQKTVTIPSFPSPTPYVMRIAIWMFSLFLMSSVGVSNEINPSLAIHFGDDQFGKESLWHNPESEGMETGEHINRHPLVCKEWSDQTRVLQKFFAAVCNLQIGPLGGTLWLSQLGQQLWHPLRREKSIRFAFDQIGSMEIPQGVFFWLGYWVVGLDLGLLVSTDLGLIVWSA